MTDEWRIAQWGVRLAPGRPPAVVDEATGEEIATVHGADRDPLQRALLIAKAPQLRDAVRAAVKVFSAMKELGTERERAVGEDMLPSLEAALYGLDDSDAQAV